MKFLTLERDEVDVHDKLEISRVLSTNTESRLMRVISFVVISSATGPEREVEH